MWIAQRLRRLWLHTVLLGLAMLAAVVATIVATARAPAVAERLGGEVGVGLVLLGGLGLLGCLGARGWWRGLALLGTGILAGAFAADLWLPALPQPRWLMAEVLVGTTVLGLSFLGLVLTRRIRLLRRSRDIRHDLHEGMLERFEGPRPSAPVEPLLARLQTAAAARHDATIRLEALPRCGLVVRVSGRRVERWETTQVVDIAPAQPHALRVALPEDVVPTVPDPRLCLKRRSLTPQERAELGRHIDRLRRRWWPAVALTVVVLVLVAWDLRGAAPDELVPLDGASLGWLALLVVVYVGYVRRMLAARKLEHDRRLRWVVTVHRPAADPRRDPPTLEVLPISQLAWTEQAAPAGWRLSKL